MTDDDTQVDDLTLISRAHGAVGSYNGGYWRKLVARAGLAAVLAACDEIWSDTRQPANAAQIDVVLEAAAKADGERDECVAAPAPRPALMVDADRRSLEQVSSRLVGTDTAALQVVVTNASARRQRAAEQLPPSTKRPATPAAVPVVQVPSPSPTSAERAAAIAKPFGLTLLTQPTQPKEITMPKPVPASVDKALTKQFDQALERLGYGSKTKAATALKISNSTVTYWQKNGVPSDRGDDVRAFIAKAVAPDDDASPAAVKTEAIERKPVAQRKTAKATGGGAAVDPDPAGLLDRGAQLADHLAGIGALSSAQTVTQLVDWVQQIRRAVGL